jgi:hypothetical protein
MTSPSAPSVLARTSIGESECVRLNSETCQTHLRMTVLRLVIAYSTFFHSSQSANNDQLRGTALEGQRSSPNAGKSHAITPPGLPSFGILSAIDIQKAIKTATGMPVRVSFASFIVCLDRSGLPLQTTSSPACKAGQFICTWRE